MLILSTGAGTRCSSCWWFITAHDRQSEERISLLPNNMSYKSNLFWRPLVFCCLQHICKTWWMFSTTNCTSLQWNVSLSVSGWFWVTNFGSKCHAKTCPKIVCAKSFFSMKSVFECNVYLIITGMHISLCLLFCFFFWVFLILFLLSCMMVSDNKK